MSSQMKQPHEAPSLLSPSVLSTDQQTAVTRLYEHDHTFLVCGMGGGKTIIALTAIEELMRTENAGPCLVVAPKRVVTEVWAREHLNWEHTYHMDVQACVGTVAARRKVVHNKPDVLVINFELLPWFLREPESTQYRMLVIDELSRLKETGGTTFKRLRPRLKQFDWTVGMTGTPVAEDLSGLFGQMLVVDKGEALGKNKSKFLEQYFFPTDFNQYNWAPHESRIPELMRKIAPTVYTVPDYSHDLPKLTINKHYIDMPPHVMDAYRELKRESVLGEEVTAVNAAVLTQKLQQVAGGFFYDDKGEAWVLSGKKLETACAIAAEHAGPSMFVYWYLIQSDYLSPLGPLLKDDDRAIGAWNRGELQSLLVHPRSCGHGLNLQHGGCHQVWCGPIWPNDLWLQTIARLWRRGQTEEVVVDVVLARDTIDEAIMARLEGKAEWHAMLLEHLNG